MPFSHPIEVRFRDLDPFGHVNHAAVLTFLHWAALKDWGGLAPALVHFTPVILLSAWRIWYWYLRPRPVRATA